MKKLLNQILYGIVTCGLILISTNNLQSQNFQMSGTTATYNATCGGVIKMNNVSSKFVNTNGATLGTTTTAAIEGVVDWAATTNGQTVQGLYYERMVTSGAGTKTVADGVYITGAACPTPLNGYALLATYPFFIDTAAGANTFNGTFHYVGDVAQNVYPIYTSGGSNVNNYNDLSLEGTGTKTFPTGTTVGIAGALTTDASTPLVVDGIAYLGTGASTLDGTVTMNNTNSAINFGTGATTFNNDVTINAGSLVATTGDGIVTIGTGSDLVLAGNDAKLNFGDNTNLVITGTADNNGNGTNLIFACTSTVTYDGAANQLVMPTIAANPYGNLILTSGAKRGGTESYGANVYLCNDFTLNGGGNFDMYTNSGILYLQAVDAVVTYGANEEVEGKMDRLTDAAARTYVFNNKNTIMTLAADADNPTHMQMNVRPGVAPNNYDAAIDINRKVNLTYTGNAGDFAFTARVGYLEGERSSWVAPNTQANVRFYEADGTNAPEKVSTNNTYTRSASSGANLGYVQLAGIGNTATTATPNGLGLFASTNDFLLRTGAPTFYTIADGRWTNPNTWDEGSIPDSTTNAIIKHAVYVGIDGPFIGTNGGADNVPANNTQAEKDAYPSNIAAANKITIDSVANASLVIGNEDNGAGYVFKTILNTGDSFVNNNKAAATGTFPMVAKASVTKLMLNGLWLSNIGNTGAQLSAFGTYQILNLGTINNEGIIDLGK